MTLTLLRPAKEVLELSPSVSLEKMLEKDITSIMRGNLDGVRGMTIDKSTDHVWFGTNHLGLVHELDEDFNLREQYDPQVGNFRKIRFIGNNAYVTDANGSLESFRMPGFVHQHTLGDLSIGYRFHPDHIAFNDGKIFVGSGKSETADPSYPVCIIDPDSLKIVGRKTLKDASVIFDLHGKLYALSSVSKVLAPKPREIFRLGNDLRIEGSVPVNIPGISPAGNENVYVDNRGVAYVARNVYDHAKGCSSPWLIAFDVKTGNNLGSVKLREKSLISERDFFINPICFDNRGNLVGLLSRDDKKLFGVKYEVQYKG